MIKWLVIDFSDLEEDDLNAELNLPVDLQSLSIEEKKYLLSFKTTHTEV